MAGSTTGGGGPEFPTTPQPGLGEKPTTNQDRLEGKMVVGSQEPTSPPAASQGFGEKPTNDAGNLGGHDYRNEPYPGRNAEGLLEKPTNDADAIRAFYDRVSEKYLAPMTPEQRQELAAGAREYMKKVLGVSDTSELSPDAAKTFNAIWDWLLGKMSR